MKEYNIKDISLLYKFVKFFVKFLSKYQLHNWSHLLIELIEHQWSQHVKVRRGPLNEFFSAIFRSISTKEIPNSRQLFSRQNNE